MAMNDKMSSYEALKYTYGVDIAQINNKNPRSFLRGFCYQNVLF
jgi:hypothetical protein